MYWMAAEAIMLPLGYLVGEKREELRSWLFPRLQKRPSPALSSETLHCRHCQGIPALNVTPGIPCTGVRMARTHAAA